MTAKMSDKLSDSGIIAILIAKKEEDKLITDELTFSCRALGRNIEDIVINKMLNCAKDYLKTSNNIIINYKKGQRNLPALEWLSSFIGERLKDEGFVEKNLLDDFETYGLLIQERFYVNSENI